MIVRRISACFLGLHSSTLSKQYKTKQSKQKYAYLFNFSQQVNDGLIHFRQNVFLKILLMI
jgi:hypothetical protein